MKIKPEKSIVYISASYLALKLLSIKGFRKVEKKGFSSPNHRPQKSLYFAHDLVQRSSANLLHKPVDLRVHVTVFQGFLLATIIDVALFT